MDAEESAAASAPPSASAVSVVAYERGEEEEEGDDGVRSVRNTYVGEGRGEEGRGSVFVPVMGVKARVRGVRMRMTSNRKSVAFIIV